ncbi:MAG: exopolysaccharide biosynthesis polyprenyl glycosylphosphotransferase [Actinobacteria bacterium]|nr:exopolysaccharide biosynthesis polyprenyl glycosylphosphotransferase [Actinomycetota bacterium]
MKPVDLHTGVPPTGAVGGDARARARAADRWRDSTSPDDTSSTELGAAARACAPHTGSGRDAFASSVATAGAYADHLSGDGTTRADTVATDRRASTFRRLIGTADLLAATVALVVTGRIFGGVSISLFAALIVLVPTAKIAGLYDRDEYVLHKTTLDEVPGLLTVSLVFVISAFAARDVLIQDEDLIGAGQLVALAALTLGFLTAGRVTARRVALLVTTPERCLLLGDAEGCDRIARKIREASALKATIVGQLDLNGDLHERDPELLAHVSEIRHAVATLRADRLIVVPGSDDSHRLPEIVRAVKSIGVKVSVLPRLIDAVGSAVEIDDIGGTQLVGVRDLKMTASSSILKRTMDLAGAAIGLLLLSPVLLAAALAIKFDSRGPVFYRQARVGRNGRQFEMFKFRSMREGAHEERDSLMDLNEAEGLFKLTDDPRVTRVGRLLRRSSLDELPQLLNVLRGDMSLVGPRPLVPEEDENITGWYRRRSHIMPGVTGVWQLLGPVRIPLDEMVRIDYLYVTHWSLWSDVKILLRTIPFVLGRRGL